MMPEQLASMLPSKVLFELLNALIFSLFEQGKIDTKRIVELLEDRQTQHKSTDPAVALMMQASIDWLKTLRVGEPMPPSTLH